MLLERLRERAMTEGNALPPGYQLQPIRYVCLIDGAGTLFDIVDTADPQTHKRGRPVAAPFVKRTSGITPLLLVDNAEYVFGIPRSESSRSDRVVRMHESFRGLVSDCAAATGDKRVAAVSAFLQRLDQVPQYLPEGFDPRENISFLVRTLADPVGSYPFDSDEVVAFWQRHLAPLADDKAKRVHCMICGELAVPLAVHPLKIKGIPGGQTGKDIVSANAKAFESYGLERSHIAPTCAACAEAYGNALNALLSTKETHLWTKELAYAFWTTEKNSDTERLAGLALQEPEAHPDQVRTLLNAYWRGDDAPLYVSEERFYAVSLGASGARVVVKDWIDTTVGDARRSLGRYFALQEMVKEYAADTEFLPMWRLTGATVRAKDTPLPIVSQSLIRLALVGTPLPMDLLFLAVRRNRAEQTVSRARAALIKMVLASRGRMNKKELELMAHLNREDTRPAYNCGRLLALLDRIQYFAIGSANASIIDRYYGAASSAPASVFGTLLHGAQNHMGKLRREKGGLYHNSEIELEEIVGNLASFPTTLSLEDQGVFALGFYHQRASYRKAKDTDSSEA